MVTGTFKLVLYLLGMDMSGSPPGEYSQEIPSQELQQRTTGPPILPPQLLQVILNKDIGPQVGATKWLCFGEKGFSREFPHKFPWYPL